MAHRVATAEATKSVDIEARIIRMLTAGIDFDPGFFFVLDHSDRSTHRIPHLPTAAKCVYSSN